MKMTKVRACGRPRHRSGHSHPEPPFLLLPSLTERKAFSMKIPLRSSGIIKGISILQSCHPRNPSNSSCLTNLHIPRGVPGAQDPEYSQLQNLCPKSFPYSRLRQTTQMTADRRRQTGKRLRISTALLLSNQGKPERRRSWATADRQSVAAGTLPFWTHQEVTLLEAGGRQ